MNEEDIRMLNSDFNYKHYGCFYEQLEKDKKEPDKQEAGKENENNKAEPASKDQLRVQGFEKLVSENNILNQMWNRVQLDPALT